MNDDRDFTIARHVARMSNTNDARPRHIRLAGLAFVLTALMCFGFSVDGINWEHRFFPKLILLIPAASSTGVWFLVDARALSSGRRRHQKMILWGCLGVSFVLAIAVSQALAR